MDWLMRIEGVMHAHFIDEQGNSKPGSEWVVGLKKGEQIYSVMVRSSLSQDITRAAKSNLEYQGQTVMGYLHDLLQQGWTPDQPREHRIVIQNPTVPLQGKPWWKFW